MTDILTRGRELVEVLNEASDRHDAETVRLLCDALDRATKDLDAATEGGRRAVHRAEEAETPLLYERQRPGGDGPCVAERLTRYRAGAMALGLRGVDAEDAAHAMLGAEREPER